MSTILKSVLDRFEGLPHSGLTRGIGRKKGRDAMDIEAISRSNGEVYPDVNIPRTLDRLAEWYNISREEVERLLNAGQELATISFIYRIRKA